MAQVYKRGKSYYIDYFDHNGKRVRESISTNRQVAQSVLGERLQEIEKLKHKHINTDPRHASRTFKEHADSYTAHLERQGRDAKYIYNIGKRLEKAREHCHWKLLKDASPQSIDGYLGYLQRDLGRSPKTVNDHRADLSAFFKWCVEQGRMEVNPVERVSRVRVKKEKKRRALSAIECRALLKAAPAERSVAYAFLMLTGLRRGEAERLHWGDIHLDSVNPRVDLPASITKSGRSEAVPLVPDLAELLRKHRGDAEDGESVFGKLPSMAIFRRDLKAADIEEQDHRGRKVVLHSLRHSLATMLAASNVPMPVAQRIMRHSDIRLTAETYTDEGLLPLAEAMNKLPSIIDPDEDAEAIQATGTDDELVTETVPCQVANGDDLSHRTEVAGGGRSSQRLDVSGLGIACRNRDAQEKTPRVGLEPTT